MRRTAAGAAGRRLLPPLAPWRWVEPPARGNCYYYYGCYRCYYYYDYYYYSSYSLTVMRAPKSSTILLLSLHFTIVPYDQRTTLL